MFGVFLVSAPGRGELSRSELRGDLEAFGVVRPLLVDEEVGGRLAKLPLRDLLEVALVVDSALAVDGFLDLGLDDDNVQY